MRLLILSYLLLTAAATGGAQPAPYRAVVLDDPALPARGFRTPAAAFRRAFTAEGIPVTFLSAVQLADPARFNADRFDLLVVPTGATFPLPARAALLAFLQRGGDLFCTGGYAFDDLRVPQDGKWIPYALHMQREMARARDPQVSRIANGGFEEGSAGWTPENPTACRIIEDAPFAGRRCAEVESPSVGGGARWSAVLPVQPGGNYLVGAHLRTRGVRGAGFAFLAVYQYDAQGNLITFKDFVQATGTQHWRRHEMRLAVAPNAARVLFHGGLYLAEGRMAFDAVTCAPLPPEERINAHFGVPGDALGIEPTQLTLYSPDQPLAGSSLHFAAGGPLAGAWQSPGAVRGFEATAQLRQNARWLSLVEARDACGRFSGAAGALVSHFAGPFAGSRWALFGVTNRDVFAGPPGEALLRRVARLLRSGVQAERLTTNYALYHPGETAQITLTVANRSRQARTVTALIEVGPPGGTGRLTDMRTVTLLPGGRQELAFSRLVHVADPDFLAVQATLMEGEVTPLRFQDVLSTGFCVRSARVVAGGPHLTYRANAFELRPAPSRLPPLSSRLLLFGTDTWASWFSSPSHSPLTWYRDLQAMRDHGLHMYENLQYSVPPDYAFTEAQWRQFDAVIQLSQRFGLPYMAGLLIGADVVVDDETMGKQAAMCRAFAARYKAVPGLIYYLNGDFRLDLKDLPDIRRLWNEFLQARYGTDDAMRHAWGADAPAEPLGLIPVRDALPGTWLDRRGRDVAAFKASLVRRWVGALCEAIRQEDRTHPITSEYYQRPLNGIDLRLTLDGMDAANYGYFGPPRTDIAQLLATIKWNDKRLAGKTVNIGEFGVKTHDAWARERDPWGYQEGRTEEEQRRLFWWVVHAALAFDVTKIQNWCWADDPDGVFPWGMAWNNPLRPKPALKLYRNLRVLSDRVPREDRRAPVVLLMPDNWRLGAPEPVGWGGLMNAIECLLATSTPFDVADYVDLPALRQKPPRALIAPFAYAMPASVVETLRALAEGGCQVYLSGDPSIGPEEKRLPARLERLCGVRLARERARPDGLPAPEVEAAGATAVSNPAGRSLYRFNLGKGAVWYSPEPWESLTGRDVFVRDPQATADARQNLYLALLPMMGVRPAARVEAKAGVWCAMVTPAGPNRLAALFPRGPLPGVTPATLAVGGRRLQWEVRPQWPCAALLDARGRPLAATGGRALRVDGAEAARGDSAWLLVALDGKPLAQSGALAAALTGGGRLRWRSAARDMAAWVVEWRDGRTVAVAPAKMRRMAGGWEVSGPPNDLVLVCPKAQAARWLRALDRW